MKDIHYERMRDCFDISKNSPDPSTKVGAKLYDSEKNSSGDTYYCLAVGYNSFPKVMDQIYVDYNNREAKYDRIIHAEMRCLLHAGSESHGSTLYTSMVPCKECAKHIAEMGVANVYYPSSAMQSDFAIRQPESIETALLIFTQCNINVFQVEGI